MKTYPAWLTKAILYQIYPQSFQDSNRDGIGDIPGIISRLPYISSLGVNTLWLNPCFDSPFGDAGYDIRNFYKVAPRYGTNDDLAELFKAAHANGMRVILDLVAGHTSMDNPWFIEEAQNPKDPDSNRYVWRNREFDPAAGPAKEDFFPSFFWYQPALNYGWEQPTEPWQDPVDAPGPRKNREELRKILSYWMDMGCDGFRVDMASTLVKHSLGGQGSGCEGNRQLWRELREWWDEHYPENLLVAEWAYPDKALEAGFHLDFMMHFNAPGYPSLFFNGEGTIPPKEGPCYFDAKGKGNLKTFRKSYLEQLEACKDLGYVSLPSANHDIQRPRCGERGWEGLRPVWVFLMTQAGVPSIYYGDEIGMRFVPFVEPKEGSTLKGIVADNAGTSLGERAGTRTPMQWDDSMHAGFSAAEDASSLYLPLDPDEERPTVKAQEGDPDSLLNFIRKLIQLRSEHPALGADGSYEILNAESNDYPLVVLRRSEAQRCLIFVNPLDRVAAVELDLLTEVMTPVLEGGLKFSVEKTKLDIKIAPFGYGIYSLSPSA